MTKAAAAARVGVSLKTFLRRYGWVCIAVLAIAALAAWFFMSETQSGGEGAPGNSLSDLASGTTANQQQVSWAREIISYVTLPFLLEGAFVAIKISVLAMIGGLIMGLGLRSDATVAPRRSARFGLDLYLADARHSPTAPARLPV